MARDGLNIGLLHIGHVLLMLTVSNPCVILKSLITSVLSRLYFKEGRPRVISMSVYCYVLY